MKKWILALVLAVGTVGLAACGDDEPAEDTQPQTETSEPVKLTDEEKMDEEEVVAVVNGTELTGNKYNPLYLQVKMLNQQFGQGDNEPETVKEQTMIILIEQEQNRQDAEEQNIEVADQEAEDELKALIAEVGEEDYESVLEENEMTEEEFKKQIKDDLITQKYMDEQFDTDVSKEEIQKNYDTLKEENEELGELEDVEDQIRELVAQEKETEQLQERLEELKEKAEIEELI